MTAHAGEFAKTGYSIVRSAIAETRRGFLFDHLVAVYGGVSVTGGDEQVAGTPYAYGDLATEGLLKSVQPVIEAAVGLELDPTYSYLRLYKRGDTLKKHTDRAACEISATLCVGYLSDSPWPIWLGIQGHASSITLLAGDMLIYRGTEMPHWREAYDGDRIVQVFLHYVDRNGPHREWKFDKRPHLGAGQSLERTQGQTGQH